MPISKPVVVDGATRTLSADTDLSLTAAQTRALLIAAQPDDFDPPTHAGQRKRHEADLASALAELGDHLQSLAPARTTGP